VVFYGEKPVFLSFGLNDNVHYLAYFNHDFLVFVPGSYGSYKIGSLGKLAALEKKSSIIQKTFSSMTSSYIDFYFYPKKIKIYSLLNSSDEEFFIPKLGLTDLIGANYVTNANFFNRLYLFFFLLNKNRNNFSLLQSNFNLDKKNRFIEEDFFIKYQGYFYQNFLRKERKNLEIFYKNYSSSQVLTRIIEGEGIKVVDLIPSYKIEKNCQIIESSPSRRAGSQTAFFLAKIFNCKVKEGESGIGDIRLILGEKLEEEWE
jgi:hypothetical protein